AITFCLDGDTPFVLSPRPTSPRRVQMSTPFRALLCSTAVALTLSSASIALACVTDAECDNADPCSAPDTCNAGSCVLGGGGDANDDLVCDAEFDPGFEFNMTR